MSQASKKGTVLSTNKATPSYYSRHGGLSGKLMCVLEKSLLVINLKIFHLGLFISLKK